MPSSLTVAAFDVVLGIAIGLMLNPLTRAATGWLQGFFERSPKRDRSYAENIPQ
jgi:hypothetical protein